MARVLERDATLRLELFTSDLRASLEFYERVLGFEKEAERPGGYTPLAKGSVRIAVNLRSDLHEDHPIRPLPTSGLAEESRSCWKWMTSRRCTSMWCRRNGHGPQT
jgi:glyoxalase/bleomycin resistance protein/dioxygenase superfamily protein